jgi:hypothetical protein
VYPLVGVDKDLTYGVGPIRYGDESIGIEAVISSFYFLFNINNEAMSKKHNGVNYSRTQPKQSRRRRVLGRLQQQLEAGVKTKTVDGVTRTVDLTDKDTKRIKREIETLKERL